MPAISASAPGKIILLGEHAVVYGISAIAAPVFEVQARAVITPLIRAKSGTISISAKQIGVDCVLSDLPETDPLRRAVAVTLDTLGKPNPPAMRIQITSSIPIAAGMGSGAAIAVALIRALSTFLGKPLEDSRVSALAFEVEKIYHGNPSGIDNAIVTFARPILFNKTSGFQTLHVGCQLHFLIANTGIVSSTRTAVEGVRQRWMEQPGIYQAFFDEIGHTVTSAVQAIHQGDQIHLGLLMNKNHAILKSIGVSHPLLDTLADCALEGGAFGAKLSGAGLGGNLIALVSPAMTEKVKNELLGSGAVSVISTRIPAN